MFKYIFILSALVFVACQPKSKEAAWEISAPAGKQFTHIDYKGTTVIPNGRLLTPYGKQILLPPHPFGLAVSSDGQTAITSNSGVYPFSISTIENPNGEFKVSRFPEPEDKDNSTKSVFMGLAISPDNAKVYVAGGQDNKVYVVDLKTKKLISEISCNKSFDTTDYSDAYLGDMILTRDGSTLYVADEIGFRIVVIDTKTNKVIDNVKTGRYPFCIALSQIGRAS